MFVPAEEVRMGPLYDPPMSSAVPVGFTPHTVVAQRSVGALSCVETRYIAGQVLPIHAHARANLVLVVAGTFDERVGHSMRRCGPGAVLYRPPHEDHADEFSTAGRCLTVELDDAASARYREMVAAPSSVIATSPRLGVLVVRLDAELRENDDAAVLAIEGLVLETMAELVRCDLRGGSSLASAVERAWMIVREESDRPLHLEAVAARVGAHPVSLARAFRRRYRMTLGEAIRHERVSVACRMLATTDLGIAEIAASCGFADHSHLTRVFRRLVGMSPGRYRERG